MEENNPNNELHVLDTYKNDLKDAIESKNKSTEAIMIAEVNQKELKGEIRRPVQKTSHRIFWIFILILIAGFAIYFYAKNIQNKKVDEVANISPYTFSNFIKSDNDVLIDISDNYSTDNLTQKIREQSIISTATTTSFAIISNQYQLTSSDFIKLFSPDNSVFTTNLKDAFMLGNIKSLTSNDKFIIFKTSNYNDLKKELFDNEPKIANIFNDAFKVTVLPKSTFSDLTIGNINARAISTDSQILIYYTFLDKETLLVARDPELAKTISQQLIK